MRLFIGIDLPKEVKESLAFSQEEIKKLSPKGNFTPKENFHITLQFIGETDSESVEDLQEAIFLTAQRFKKFDVAFDKEGVFSRGNSFIIWQGVQKNPLLYKMRNVLAKNIARIGYKGNKGNFEPHITLVRQSPLDLKRLKVLKLTPPQSFTADAITLFESVRQGNKLTYKRIFEEKF